MSVARSWGVNNNLVASLFNLLFKLVSGLGSGAYTEELLENGCVGRSRSMHAREVVMHRCLSAHESFHYGHLRGIGKTLRARGFLVARRGDAVTAPLAHQQSWLLNLIV